MITPHFPAKHVSETPASSSRFLRSFEDFGTNPSFRKFVFNARIPLSIAGVMLLTLIELSCSDLEISGRNRPLSRAQSDATSQAQVNIATPLLFSGNATIVAPPTADTEYAFGAEDFGALYRKPDCTLEGVIASVGGQSALSVKPNYQDKLHSHAGLTTKGDLWPDGCTNPNANNPAYIAVMAGQAPNNKYIVATIDAHNSNQIDIYQLESPVASQKIVTLIQTISVGPNVFPIAAADLDGDGDQDLVVGFSGTTNPNVVNGGFAVLLSKGDGTFGTPTIVQTPNAGIAALSLVDLNHDGKPDIAALEFSLTGTGTSASVQIFLGKAGGKFTAGSKYSASGFPGSLVVADLDGDKHLDIVLTTGQLLLGNGDGTFKTGKALSLPSDTGYLVAADFNKDNKTDLALVTYHDIVGVFLGNGDGTVQAPVWYSGVYQSGGISTTDLDGDGNLDLVLGAQSGSGLAPTPNTVAGPGGLGVLMGNGDGTFRGAAAYRSGATQNSFAYAIADIDGDGKQDVITPVSLLVGDGKGQLTVHSGTQFPGVTAINAGPVIRTADLNNDTKIDAIVTTLSGTARPIVFMNQGAGKFKAGTHLAVNNVIDVAIADFTQDKIPDVALLSYKSGSGISVHVMLGKGNGTFGSPLAVTLPAEAAKSTGGQIFAADLNGDGKTDLVVLDAGDFVNSVNGGTYVFLGDGKGGFTLSEDLTDVPNPFDAAIADFNKDGKLDLVLSSTDFDASFTAQPMIFLGDGKGKFGAGKSIPTVSEIPMHLAAADFNKDGKLDLLIGSCCGLATTSIVLGKGDGTFQPEQILHVAASPSQIAVGDLNGDGRPDIVTSSGITIGVLETLINQYGVIKP
jgi:FG-GAP-like repeat